MDETFEYGTTVVVNCPDSLGHNRIGVVVGSKWGKYIVDFEGGPNVEDCGVFASHHLKRWGEEYGIGRTEDE